MDHEKIEQSGPRFEPALWRQRKLFACQTLIDSRVTSVIDFGCGEGALTSTLISLYDENNPITCVAAVDISRECLDLAIEACEPQTMDLGDHVRPFELNLHFFQGSVDAADERLMGYDGLACMEVVEHLDPSVLDGFWKVVLEIYRPKVAVVSTPNAEFNIHFPNLRYGTPESTFRHWDHRFEWTRQQFQDWCTEAAERYGYSVEFSGVGTIDDTVPPEGYCSQIAVLKLLDASTTSIFFNGKTLPPGNSDTSTPYTHIRTIEYPFYNIDHSEEELIDFIHNRIALIRPLPMPSATTGNGDTFYGQGTELQDQNAERKPLGSTSSSVQSTMPLEHVEERDLDYGGCGRLHLNRLWSEYQVQQRFKTRNRLIELLLTSSLVRLNEDRSLILYDEANPFWAEFERRYEERMTGYDDDEYGGDDDGVEEWCYTPGESYHDYAAIDNDNGYSSSEEFKQSCASTNDDAEVSLEEMKAAWLVPAPASASSDSNGWGVASEPDTWEGQAEWTDKF